MLQLNNVTLVGVDCINVERLQKAISICESNTKFGATKILTSLKTDNKNAVNIPHIGSIQEYSRFMIKDLVNYIDTEYALCVQWDGFIVNDNMYSDEFLKYDYIGALWSWNDEKSVGNGGFSLRSKRFLEACSKLQIKNFHPEDLIIGRIYKSLLTDQGMTYAPNDIARKFSFEGNNLVGHSWPGNTWGFHDLQMSDMSNWIGYNNFIK